MWTGCDRLAPFLYNRPATLFDYLGETVVFVSEYAQIKESLKNQSWQLQEDMKLLLEEGILFKGCDRYSMELPEALTVLEKSRTALLDSFGRSMAELPLRRLVHINAVQLSCWGGEVKVLAEELRSYLDRGWGCCVLGGTKRRWTP